MSEKDKSAASMAVQYLIQPDEDRMVEVSYLPQGVVHALTMLQAYEKQLESLLEPVRNYQLWYIKREARRKKKDDRWVKKQFEVVKKNDEIKMTELFIHRFRFAFYQTSRGRDGKFVESLVLLSDTDLQTRSTDMENPFRNIREQ